MIFLFLVIAYGLKPASVFAEPSADELRDTIRAYIQTQEKLTGSFTLADSKEKVKLRTL
jgi:GTP-binding protein EngB required for normal cell division